MLKSFTLRDKVAFTYLTVLIKKQFVRVEGEEKSMIQSPVSTATAKSALFVSYPIRAGDDGKDADMVDCKKKKLHYREGQYGRISLIPFSQSACEKYYQKKLYSTFMMPGG